MADDPRKRVREQEAIGAGHARQGDRRAASNRLGHAVGKRGRVGGGHTGREIGVPRRCLEQLDARGIRLDRRGHVGGCGTDRIAQDDHLHDAFARVDESIVVRCATVRVAEYSLFHNDPRRHRHGCRRKEQCVFLRRRHGNISPDNPDDPVSGRRIVVGDNLLDDVEMVFLLL